jgi:hypothetical protein
MLACAESLEWPLEAMWAGPRVPSGPLVATGTSGAPSYLRAARLATADPRWAPGCLRRPGGVLGRLSGPG